ncbi:unnamed protein product [Gongylonema pulchrum]|uniref:Innexin n=1 Tax=Gongylonema pulchrum TaxID=637853 RepID=A0A183DGU5_9BILA|nr:unnamed protein product [Gongylonema pulchrum]
MYLYTLKVLVWFPNVWTICLGIKQQLTIGGDYIGSFTELVFDVIAKQDMQCFHENFTQYMWATIELRVGYIMSVNPLQSVK